MLSTTGKAISLAVGQVTPAVTQQQRGMATLKDSSSASSIIEDFNKIYPSLFPVSIRLKSIKNIQKITQSMKMVAAAKYSRAERDLQPARPYGEGSKGSAVELRCAFFKVVQLCSVLRQHATVVGGGGEEARAPHRRDDERQGPVRQRAHQRQQVHPQRSFDIY